jgi:hypothetical protein
MKKEYGYIIMTVLPSDERCNQHYSVGVYLYVFTFYFCTLAWNGQLQSNQVSTQAHIHRVKMGRESDRNKPGSTQLVMRYLLL